MGLYVIAVFRPRFIGQLMGWAVATIDFLMNWTGCNKLEYLLLKNQAGRHSDSSKRFGSLG